MADIDVTCSACATIMTVSEHVDLDLIKCRKCGGPMQKSATAAEPVAPPPKPQLKTSAESAPLASTLETPPPAESPKTGKLKMRPQEALPPPTIMASAAALQPGQPEQKIQKEEVVVMKASTGAQMWKAWAVFIVLGGIAATVRYSGLLPLSSLDFVKTWSPLVIGILYISIALLAFKDGVFNGILSVLIPFYPFYYIFAVADDFYFRSVTAALLIMCGEDSAYFYGEYANNAIEAVNEFIRSGGG